MCNKCGKKPRKTTKGGNTGQCIDCNRAAAKKWRNENKKHILKYEKEYREQNKEKRSKAQKQWKINNKDKVKIYNKEYFDKYYKDINNKLAKNLRNRLRQAVIKGYKNGSSVNDLGCSINEFKLYLESKFRPGMSWNNYGSKVGCWNIDHILPLTQFNLADRDQLLVACHYTNLQPMWMIDNSHKCNRKAA